LALIARDRRCCPTAQIRMIAQNRGSF